MRKHPALSLTLAGTHEIDAEDRTYAVSPTWFPLKKLLLSIQEAGLLTPLWLERSEAPHLRIIAGFRRFRVAQQLKMEEVPCVVFQNRPPLETFMFALAENMGSRELNEIENAIVVDKLRHQFSLSESELTRHFLPRLGLKPDLYHLRRYLDIAKLPEGLLRALGGGLLHADIALALTCWKCGEQTFFIELVSSYQMGRNKQRELFELLSELRSIERCEVFGPWERSGAREVHEDQRLAPQDRINGIKLALRSLRYPRLTDHERRFQKLRNALKLPTGARLNVPSYFEGSQIRIEMCADSPARLRKVLSQCERSLDRKELDQIFELL
jgi:ParB/RepB/Spo0J family partition protein